MKVLIVSDSHGKNTHLERVLEKEKDIDFLIHLGDLEGTEQYLAGILQCPMVLVSGNNDYFSNLEREKLFELKGYQIFITHGHRYQVYEGAELLKEIGKELKADIVMFGHTHIPYLDTDDGIIILNPGSISQPRQKDKIPTYIIMEISETRELSFTIHRVNF